MNPLQINFTLPATGETQLRNCGEYKFVYIRSASEPFKMSFDGVIFFEARQNDRFSVPVGSATLLTAYSDTGRVINALVLYSENAIDTQDTLISVTRTQILGNFGTPDGSGELISNGHWKSPSVTWAGWIQLDAFRVKYQPSTSLPGTRQLITLRVIPAALAQSLGYQNLTALQIWDSHSNDTVAILQAGETITIPTSDLPYLGAVQNVSNNGTVWFTAMEVFAVRVT